MFDAGAWVPLASLGSALPRLGINTTADTTNRLAVSAAATLLTHAGAGHQLKINKNAAGDTASLLYQTSFSGRAEMGLAGDDNWRLKVSPDGSSWINALTVNAATGVTTRCRELPPRDRQCGDPGRFGRALVRRLVGDRHDPDVRCAAEDRYRAVAISGLDFILALNPVRYRWAHRRQRGW